MEKCSHKKRGMENMEIITGSNLVHLIQNFSDVSFSQAKVAELMGLGTTTISRYLQESYKPNRITFQNEKTCSAFMKLRDDYYKYDIRGFVNRLLDLLINDLNVPAIAYILNQLFEKESSEKGENDACKDLIDELYKMYEKKITIDPSAVVSNNSSKNTSVNPAHRDDDAKGKKEGYLFAENPAGNVGSENAGKTVLACAKKMCEKAVSMKYGSQGIDVNYLSRLYLREKIPGMNDVYKNLSEIISDYSRVALNIFPEREIRLLLSGDAYFGRTTQLLTYCQKALNENNIVFYISPHALKNKELFSYIYDTYLGLPCLKNCNATIAFQEFKRMVRDEYQITLVIDGYEYIDQSQRECLDNILKYEDPLIADVNVIVKVRFRDTSWPHNYIEAMTRGVSCDVVKNELGRRRIDYGQIQSIASSLQSPWLLKLLINDITTNVDTITNPGQLLQQSIVNRVEFIVNGGRVKRHVLRFSVYALLPQLVKDKNFIKAHLLNALPTVVNHTVDLLARTECIEVREYLQQENFSNKRMFEEFFEEPIVVLMDLMKEENNSRDRTQTVFEWKDHALCDFFYAIAILHLFDSHNPQEAFPLIQTISDGLLQLDDVSVDASIDQSVFACFDIARFFIDIIDEQTLNAMQKQWTEQMALFHCGMALAYELLGKEEEKFRAATKSLSLLEQLEKSGCQNKGLIAHWYNKMAYYVIKCSGKTINDFSSAVQNAKEYLERSIQIAETENKNSTVNTRLELAKMYGNMGAFWLRQKEYSQAMEWHKKSLDLKNQCLAFCEEKEKKAVLEGQRRSLVSLATDAFYLEDYQTSIEYHEKAIKIGEGIKSRSRYESFSRIVGSKIELLNKSRNWSLSEGEKLLDLLMEDINIMGEYVNRKEMNTVYSMAGSILNILQNNGLYKLAAGFSPSINQKAQEIEVRYNAGTWSNCDALSRFFKEVR